MFTHSCRLARIKFLPSSRSTFISTWRMLNTNSGPGRRPAYPYFPSEGKVETRNQTKAEPTRTNIFDSLERKRIPSDPFKLEVETKREPSKIDPPRRKGYKGRKLSAHAPPRKRNKPKKEKIRLWTYSYQDFPPVQGRSVIKTDSDANTAVSQLEGSFLGIDIQIGKYKISDGPGNTCVVTLCDKKAILIMQVCHMNEFPSRLKEILANPKVLKVGANLSSYVHRLAQDYSLCLSGFIDLTLLNRQFMDEIAKKQDDKDLEVKVQQIEKRTLKTNAKRARKATRAGRPLDEEIEGVRNASDLKTALEENRKFIRLVQIVRRQIRRKFDGRQKGAVFEDWRRILNGQQQRYVSNNAHAAMVVFRRLKAIQGIKGESLDFSTSLISEQPKQS